MNYGEWIVLCLLVGPWFVIAVSLLVATRPETDDKKVL